MDQIKAKQIDGVMDLTSNQTVGGVKSYSSPQQFIGAAITVSIYQDAIYWCQHPGVLNEPGNSRLRMEGGTMYLETYNGSDWITG